MIVETGVVEVVDDIGFDVDIVDVLDIEDVDFDYFSFHSFSFVYNIFVVVIYVNQLSVFDIDFLIVPAYVEIAFENHLMVVNFDSP